MNRRKALIVLVFSLLFLASCRNETQNQIRRSIQDFTSDKMYITLYSLNGSIIFEGVVDGKITRSSDTVSDNSGKSTGSYIYWFDEKGQYNQTDLPYLVTSYQRTPTE
jgi:uncharacterized protein YcfL